jgi:hypothetical protein
LSHSDGEKLKIFAFITQGWEENLQVLEDYDGLVVKNWHVSHLDVSDLSLEISADLSSGEVDTVQEVSELDNAALDILEDWVSNTGAGVWGNWNINVSNFLEVRFDVSSQFGCLVKSIKFTGVSDNICVSTEVIIECADKSSFGNDCIINLRVEAIDNSLELTARLSTRLIKSSDEPLLE